MRLLTTLVALLAVVPAFAQKYEFGLHGGGSMYQSKTITAPRGTADAGFSQGFGGGFTVGHNMYERIGGEVRYTFLLNDLRLKSGSEKATFGGQSHVFHYDFLLHTSGREARVRPYVAAGGGVKLYRGTGAEAAFQPLSNVAILTKTTETQPLVSFGGGVKFALSPKIVFRVDVHDYLTPFPKEVITPVSGAKVSGWINNIVPMAGVTFTF